MRFEGKGRGMRPTVMVAMLALLALPAAAQDRPLGEEQRAREDSMEHHAREMERHARELERHARGIEGQQREMERHAREMNAALLRAYGDSGQYRVYRRDGMLDSARARYLYRASMSTPCARMGISFTGGDTIVVREVMPNSGAAEAGVRPGDVIVMVDGERADDQRLAELGERLEVGDRVRLVVRRGSAEQTIDVVAREDVCPYRTMLSEAPFRVTCLKRDSTDTDGEEHCASTFVFDMREQLEELHNGLSHWRVRTEETDSGTWLLFGDSAGEGRSLFIDLDSVRMLSETLGMRMDSIGRMMPFTFHLADSITRMMPSIRMDLRAVDEAAHAQGVMLRSMELGARALAGAQLTDLNEDLAGYFEVESGALVTRVEHDTPAARAGLLGGDVIVSVNGAVVEDVGDVRRRAAGHEGDIELIVVRRGERRTIRLDR